MLHCFQKTYARYFNSTTEHWKEKDKQIEKDIEFSMEKAQKEKENLYLDDLYEIQADKFITDNFPKPSDKDTTTPVLKHKSLTKTNFRTGYRVI
jgi:uncharacterized protein YjgD (DUF1641 family)